MQTLTAIICDFCDAWISEAWFFAHGQFQLFEMESKGLLDVKGGEAAACGACRPLVERKDEAALLRRVASANDSVQALDFMRVFHHALLGAMTGTVRYSKLGDLEPTPDRFFQDTCPRCKRVHTYDRREARSGSIKRVCPCGAQLTIGAIGRDREAKR